MFILKYQDTAIELTHSVPLHANSKLGPVPHLFHSNIFPYIEMTFLVYSEPPHGIAFQKETPSPKCCINSFAQFSMFHSSFV